jgi:hypothetical protein
MRLVVLLALAGACGGGGGNTGPRVIEGGGIGDGDIDGTVFVHVIDNTTDAPIVNAMVEISGTAQKTDADGLVEFVDVEGPQTISVKLQGYRPTVWASANGKNVTIPLTKSSATIVGQATLSGSITGWDPTGLPANHVKGAVVLYSHTDTLGDEANERTTVSQRNICTGATCDWMLVTRTGKVSLFAAIIDFDTRGTPADTDDTLTIIGWATKKGITVENGVPQTGVPLTIVEAGNLENLTIDYGASPAGLTSKASVVGIEISDDEIVQLPVFDATATTVLAPKPNVFGGTKGYRLTAVAQTAVGNTGAQSIVLRRNLKAPKLDAGTWLTPPVGVSGTRTSASWSLVAGAIAHQIQFLDTAEQVQLEMTVFDKTTTSIDVPELVALPVSGALEVRVSGIGASFDVQDFSLEDDEDKLFGLASQDAVVQ